MRFADRQPMSKVTSRPATVRKGELHRCAAYPGEHGKHLRNTNPIESAFATRPDLLEALDGRLGRMCLILKPAFDFRSRSGETVMVPTLSVCPKSS